MRGISPQSFFVTGECPEIGTPVRVVGLGNGDRLRFSPVRHSRHFESRKEGSFGEIVGFVPGDAEVILVRHDDGETAAYHFSEIAPLRSSPSFAFRVSLS